jgi:hypothetical protein
MLMLAVGSYLFGLLILLFRLNKNNPYIVPFWVEAKMLQATGSLMLYFRTGAFDGATLAANTVLLLGCAYEAWAIRILSGQTVKRRQQYINLCRDYPGMFGNGFIRFALLVGTSLPYAKHLLFPAQPVFVQQVRRKIFTAGAFGRMLLHGGSGVSGGRRPLPGLPPACPGVGKQRRICNYTCRQFLPFPDKFFYTADACQGKKRQAGASYTEAVPAGCGDGR